MQSNAEIEALIHLLDDPDQEVYKTISESIIQYGKPIIPNLEKAWEQEQNEQVQNRIESIIQQVHYNETYKNFEAWFAHEKPSLIVGGILLATYRYPDLNEDQIRKTLKSIYQSCWLEINNLLTPLEKINIINSIFFSMQKFKGFDLEENKPIHFFINEVLETRHGNSYSLALIYQVICELLDISIATIQLPRQYLLAYIDRSVPIHQTHSTIHHANADGQIQFYVDPNNGTIYSQQDVDAYLNRYKLEISEDHFKSLSNKEIIYYNMEALLQVHQQLEEADKVEEIEKLMSIFKSPNQAF